jgi:NADH-quinone oxidoreductase subunit G
MQDGEPYLAGTARDVAARVSAATAATVGLAAGDKVTVATAAGSVTVPVEVVTMADGVVWLPANSPGCAVRADLGAGHGSTVTLRRGQ